MNERLECQNKTERKCEFVRIFVRDFTTIMQKCFVFYLQSVGKRRTNKFRVYAFYSRKKYYSIFFCLSKNILSFLVGRYFEYNYEDHNRMKRKTLLESNLGSEISWHILATSTGQTKLYIFYQFSS